MNTSVSSKPSSSKVTTPTMYSFTYLSCIRGMLLMFTVSSRITYPCSNTTCLSHIIPTNHYICSCRRTDSTLSNRKPEVQKTVNSPTGVCDRFRCKVTAFGTYCAFRTFYINQSIHTSSTKLKKRRIFRITTTSTLTL